MLVAGKSNDNGHSEHENVELKVLVRFPVTYLREYEFSGLMVVKT